MPDAVRFDDAEGQEWRVIELPAMQVDFQDEPLETQTAHLVFERSSERGLLRRRLDRYPADWRTLSPAELATLCERAAPPTAAGAPDAEEELRRHLDELST